MLANCAEISKMTSGGGNWILRDLGPPEAKAFDRKYSSCIRFWNTTTKNWFRYHLGNFISFPLIYRFAGIRRVLTELEADNWKHCSNYTDPRPHYTIFKQKRYCFVPDTATVLTTTVRKRIVSKTLSRVERFENGTVWKHCFPSVDGENDTIWKRWRHHNNTTWL